MIDNISANIQKINPSATLSISTKAKEMKSQGIDIIALSVGEPDFDTPERVKKAAIEAIQKGYNKYTNPSGITELKDAIIAKLKRDNNLTYSRDEIIVSVGAKHALFNVIEAICDDNSEILVPSPFWVSYKEQICFARATMVPIPTKEENAFKLDVETLKDYLTPNSRAILINSPSNPTGVVYDLETLKKIYEFAKENNLWIISDEIYEKLIYEGEHYSIASFGEDAKDRTILINGLSKAYAMTGWRIGYAAAKKDVITYMSRLQGHTTSNPNSAAQYASVTALNEGEDDVKKMVEIFNKRRLFVLQRMSQMPGIHFVKPNGAFYVFFNIDKAVESSGGKINNSTEFCQYFLEKQHIAMVPGIAFGMENYVRISYANSMENLEKAMDRLEKGLKTLCK